MNKRILTLDDFGKVLVSYLYEPDQLQAVIEYGKWEPRAVLETVKGKRKGVVVAVGSGILGWSLCCTSKGDVFDKGKALNIALQRADLASAMDHSERLNFYEKVPFSIIDLFEEMELRSEKYFNNPNYDNKK
jgi:hypothetical protein